MSWSRWVSLFPAFTWCLNKVEEEEYEVDNGNSSYLCAVFELLKQGLNAEQINYLNELDESQSTIFHHIRLCILNTTPFNLIYVLYSLNFKFNYNFNQQSDSLAFYEKLFELCQTESNEKQLPNVFANFRIQNKSLLYECEGCNTEKEEVRINKKGYSHLFWTGPKGMTTQEFIDSILHPTSQYDCESCHTTTNWKGKKYSNFGERILIVISSPSDCNYKYAEDITVNDQNYYLSGLIIRKHRDSSFFFQTKVLRRKEECIEGHFENSEDDALNLNNINSYKNINSLDNDIFLKDTQENLQPSSSLIIIREIKSEIANKEELQEHYGWYLISSDNPNTVIPTTLDDSDIVTQLLYSKYSK